VQIGVSILLQRCCRKVYLAVGGFPAARRAFPKGAGMVYIEEIQREVRKNDHDRKPRQLDP